MPFVLWFDIISNSLGVSARLKTCTSSKLHKLAFLLIPEKREVAEALPGTCQINLQWEKWIWGEEKVQLNIKQKTAFTDFLIPAFTFLNFEFKNFDYKNFEFKNQEFLEF